MIEDVPELWIDALLPAPHPRGGDRMRIAHQPGHAVGTMYVLLDDVIAGKPCVELPITNLILHAAPFGAVLPARYRAGEIVGLNGDDIANQSRANFFHC